MCMSPPGKELNKNVAHTHNIGHFPHLWVYGSPVIHAMDIHAWCVARENGCSDVMHVFVGAVMANISALPCRGNMVLMDEYVLITSL